MLKNLFLLALLFSAGTLFAQYPESKPSITVDSLSAVEKSLYLKIMEYRAQQGLAAITLSSSLTYVAQTHAVDLANNHPNVGYCNLHSWSESRNWKRCCYTPDHKNAPCMWNKPRELTSYPGDGYEIAFYTNARFTDPDEYAAVILEGWKKSPGHNAMISNKGLWRKSTWNAIGIGVYKGFACVWFGKEADAPGFRIQIR